jgi:iron complex outermembrane recepter protein
MPVLPPPQPRQSPARTEPKCAASAPLRSLVQLALIACSAGHSAAAQAQEASATVLPKITVTGSRIPRIESETSASTLTLRRADIVRSGASSVKELIDSLTAANSTGQTLSDISGANSFAAGASSASLRNLGHQATLVLLNSRRLAAFAMDDDPGMFVNLDTLPLDAIDRIDVLRSGASALYGSDAVAGVINIITRRDYRGAQLRVTHEQPPGAKDFRSSTASITAGIGDGLDDRYNLLMNLELFKRSGVVWREVLHRSNPDFRNYSPFFGRESDYSNPGNLNFQALPGCPASQLREGVCFYDRYARLAAQPQSERTNLLLSGELHITPQLTAFTELLYSTTKTRYLAPQTVYGTSGVTTWFDPSTTQPRYFTMRNLPAEHPLNTSGAEGFDFSYRFTETDSHTLVNANNYRFLTGLRGKHDTYAWEAALGSMGGTVINRTRGALSDSAFKQLVGDYTLASDPLLFNRAYRLGQPNSPEVLNALFPIYTSRGHNQQSFVDTKISGPIGQWQGRPIDMAVGFDLRHETLSIRPSANLLAGDIVGLGVAQTEGRRSFGAVFGELSVPVTQALEIQAAARLDKYPSFGAHLSPKLGMRLQAAPQLMLRGTIEGGFRAPNLSENARSARYAFIPPSLQDPKRCPAARALAETLRSGVASLPDDDPAKYPALIRADMVETQECLSSLAVLRSSNPNLKPEKSLALTLGGAFQPARGYLVSLDYWTIRRNNEIGYKAPQDLINSEDQLPAGILNRVAPGQPDPSFTPEERVALGVQNEALSWANSQIENTTKTTTSGIDLGLQSRTLTPLGALTADLQATYLLNYYSFSALRSSYGDNLAGRYQYPRLRTALTLALTRGSLTNALQWRRISGTQLQGDFYDTLYTLEGCQSNGWGPAQCRVRSSSSLDYTLAYTPVRHLNLSFQIRNLLGQRPPLDLRALFESGAGVVPPDLRDAQRRVIKLGLEYKFF